MIQIVRVPLRARRFYDCEHYAECLTEAAHNLEPSLPCRECPRYKRRDLLLTYPEWSGILSLLEEVFRGEEVEKNG